MTGPSQWRKAVVRKHFTVLYPLFFTLVTDATPPTQIVDDWLNLLKTKFREEPGCCVAVHCVAGLGRCVREREMKQEDMIFCKLCIYFCVCVSVCVCVCVRACACVWFPVETGGRHHSVCLQLCAGAHGVDQHAVLGGHALQRRADTLKHYIPR